MVKVALLIGVSEYEPGLTPLPAATKDVKAMQQVLQNPEIGGFDDVKVLTNPQQHEMAVAIETLFDGRQKDDLALLFFSGHGIKDDGGKLYFATCNTRKNEKGGLVQATAVSANFVQDIMCTKGRSKRQVVILDCCFSGAFAEDMVVKEDGSVDLINQLGGEGRAILTSSTSTQHSFEQKGSDLSIYTRYLVEGIETGAADTNDNGVITVNELHEYARKKVQEADPRMRPEIYPVREGYTIVLAKAPLGEPKLKYRKEVERLSRRGEISSIGRKALDKLQVKLKLSSEEAIAIENEVLQPYRDYQHRLQEYEQALVEAVEQQFPLSSDTQEDLQRLQQILGLRDEDVAQIKDSIIAKQQLSATPVNENPPTRLNPNFLYTIGVCIIALFIGIGGTLLYVAINKPIVNSCAKEQYSFGDRISLGEEILVKQYTNADKEAGVKAFAKGDCNTAIDKFKRYRKDNVRDPETLIYLNNTIARQKGERLKIAVSVPIGKAQNIAEEMLRGVAQAQAEVNEDGGINGKLLEVAIANDDNDLNIATEIANKLVNDSSILAVVGPNSSNASMAVAPVFQNRKLVMLSPTSSALSIPGTSSYVFRTTPNVSLYAEKVSNYAIKKILKTNFLICFNSEASTSKSIKDEYIKAIKFNGGNINSTNCDTSTPEFNANAVISQAIKSGADGLLLTFNIDDIKKALEVVQANQKRLQIFSSATLYTQQTLQEGKADVDGMILAVPWHREASSCKTFATKAQKLWDAKVNWRTATTYDATKVVIAGLQQNDNTRRGVQQALQNPSFSVKYGAMGSIEFSSGERKDPQIFISKVQRERGSNEYDLVLIQR